MITIEDGGLGNFRINGKPYQKGSYELTVNENLISICRSSKPNEFIVSNIPLSDWRDGSLNPFANTAVFIDYVETFFFLAKITQASALSYKYVANNFTDLNTVVAPPPLADPAGIIAYVYNSQGTAWLPGSLGGTYYPEGTYVYNGTAWVSDRNNIAAAFASLIGSPIVREIPVGVINGVNPLFVLANIPIAGSEEVFLNGLLQEPGVGNDYTIVGANITFETPPLAQEKISVSYRR
jgi:hypothetical protein